jgi:hypothetical protein
MRFFNRQFITYGELLCFLAVWAIGLTVILASRGHRDQMPDGELAANSTLHHANFDGAQFDSAL